uniref:phospholipase D-like domain-containing protein n=1 Tax=Marinobacter sp. TaxID=50741 RepID=UPI0035670085
MMSMMSACQRHPVVGRSPHADVGSMLVAIMSRSMKLSLWIAVLLITSGCAVSVADKSESRALGREEAQDTRLGRAIAHRLEKHPGQSGIYTLADPQDAFAARALLARVADRTLDVQYYIWRGDVTGTLLISELHAAADRGVRVRLLLDDNGTSGLDDELSRLASHPLIEVRLFNPFALRSFKSLGYLTDFSRSNRRMHNKSFTADNQATIVGGRNVGDEYFAATEGVLFADLDVLSVGPVVNRVSADFDRYWASDSAYPVEQILNSEPPSSSSAAWQDVTYSGSHEAAARYIEAIEQADFVHELVGGDLDLEWARTRMISDDPAKGLGGIRDDTTLAHQLAEVLGRPERKVALISPYFVPTAAGVDALAALESRGVEVTVLTNSLDATDVAAVHAGYAK